MGEERYEKTIYLKADDPKSVAAKKLLDKAGRKQSILVSIMANEFMEAFGIDEDVSEKKLKQIISNYDILKNMKQFEYHPVQQIQEKTENAVKNEEEKERKELEKETVIQKTNENVDIGDKEIAELEDALSLFSI